MNSLINLKQTKMKKLFFVMFVFLSVAVYGQRQQRPSAPTGPGGGGLDQLNSADKIDHSKQIEMARARMKEKRIITTGTIDNTPLPDGRKIAWSIGKKDGSTLDLALAPDRYLEYVGREFGFEDHNFIIGASAPNKEFPYVLPGPVNWWGGTWPTAGWRTHQVNILFGVDKMADGEWKLIVNLNDYAKSYQPFVKVSINEQDYYKRLLPNPDSKVNIMQSPTINRDPIDSLALVNQDPNHTPVTLEIPLHKGVIREGGNTISIYVLEGAWIIFDNVEMVSPAGTVITVPNDVYIGDVQAADYELEEDGFRSQPLLVYAEHLKGSPLLTVELDGKKIFSSKVERNSYTFEAPMPFVTQKTTSKYRILAGGKEVRAGVVERGPQRLQTPADYVNTMIGSAHSRWMIAPGPWMPFSMVKMSPDNQNAGWQAGYQPTFESVGGISHIHCWTMAGLSMLPVNGPLLIEMGNQWDPDSGYRSRIDKRSEQAPIGFYKVHLTDYDIDLEVTGTDRCGFQRYTFPKNRGDGRVMIDFRVPGEMRYDILDCEIRQVGDHALVGFQHNYSPDTYYSNSTQEYVVHFYIEFDQPIKNFGGWIDNKQQKGGVVRGEWMREAGAWVEFDVNKNNVVQTRSGISYVSMQNAKMNLDTEIINPFGWSFDKVRKHNVDTWNEIMNRTKISINNRDEKIKFYNSIYRSLCSRSTYNDINGEWVSADFRIRQFSDLDDRAMGGDAFWNTFWNLNQVWNLITPEWSKRWVNSQLAMYDANGWLSKGAGGMKYINVMVAEHEIPLIVSAYQMGIKDIDGKKILEAGKKMQTTPPQHLAGGYAGNRNIEAFHQFKYIPWELGIFSNTMEYSFDCWSVGQLAKTLGDSADYRTFNEYGYYWKNAVNPKSGYAHLRDSTGKWYDNFDPFSTGAHVEYIEGNAWQLTFFVPQDISALVDIIGKDKFTDRLIWGFETSEPWRFNAPNEQYWNFPVVQGNQQSMHFSYLFNWAGKPWLTQKWTRSIADRFYGIGLGNAYLGDEDQGQISGWLVMAGLGLFQTDGGARSNPIYEIGSPIYDKTVIDLGGRYGRGKTFTIIARNNSRLNVYVQKATLNGKVLDTFWFPASELLKGGELVLEMGPKPNNKWGIKPFITSN